MYSLYPHHTFTQDLHGTATLERMANNTRAHFYHRVFSSQDHPAQNSPAYPSGNARVSVAQAQEGVSSRTPATASPEPSAVRPAGLSASRASLHTVPALADASSVDGERPRGGGWPANALWAD
jgi:hypothetical protein